MKILGNETADRLVKRPPLQETPPEETSLNAAISVVKRHFRDPPGPSHKRTKISYKGYNAKKEEKNSRRRRTEFSLHSWEAGTGGCSQPTLTSWLQWSTQLAPAAKKKPTLENTGSNAAWQGWRSNSNYWAVIVTTSVSSQKNPPLQLS